MKLLALPAVLAFVTLIFLARDGFGDFGGGSPAPPPDQPVTGTPGAVQPATGNALHAARLTLAKELGIDPLSVRLVRTAHAGWDGCLGLATREGICTQQFIGGYLAVFEAGGREYRFHFGGDRTAGPIDPAQYVRVDDGAPVPYELRVDLHALMAEYARHDAALRSGRPLGTVATTNIVPVTFGNACQGYAPGGRGCLEKGPLVRGAFVNVRAGATEYRYSAGPRGVVYFDPAAGQAIQSPSPADLLVQDEIRADLARRLGIPLDRVSFRSYREVVWPDSCFGVYRPDALCAQVLLRGFLAVVVDLGSGKEYAYHGSGEIVVPAHSLDTGWRAGPPADVDPNHYPGG